VKELKGKNAVIAGGADGVGRAIALVCAEAGMNVVVADIQEDLGARTAEEVAGHGVRAEFLPVNVADNAAMMALADTVFERYGDVHLLCNNAGVLDVGWTTETTLEDWEWLLSVNLWGVINGLLAFLPRMAEQSGESHILNVGSPTCFVPVVGMAPYNAAKHAVAGLTETLRIELADSDIGVTLFCPAETDTNIGPNSVKLRQQLLGTTRERPPELAAALTARRTDLKEAQQDAMQVARVALRAVQDDVPLVFSHPTPRRIEVAQRRFDDIMAAFPQPEATG
jgi:NAD(P)-dependent dehydrogenase (short-subunit alcohol dehydrogenase family)